MPTSSSGERGIRTPGRLAPTTVFKRSRGGKRSSACRAAALRSRALMVQQPIADRIHGDGPPTRGTPVPRLITPTLGTAIARWPEHQDTSGCSRPGMSCAVHAYAGQKGDAPQAAALIEGLPAEVVIADTAYDGNHLRQAIAAKGALTRHARSNIRSTSTAMPSAISSNAASPSSSSSVASQPLRKDRPKLLCRHYSRSHHLMDAISVHTT